jgi:superfamily II RNA helicase
MVKVCSYNYPKERQEEYKEHYENYSYELHDFQKWAIEAIVTGNHVLVCCPTGSGKTLPGEFALNFFHSKGKRTIYTSPIKALSNEKFYNFTQKYPHLSIGLITGDIKTNPDADVLIMTTEILLNKLYQIKSTSNTTNSSVSFEMDIENELGCVIFDEIHMINDEHRGHVWEQTIMMLPRHIQMVGLSATLDDPERFAYWLESRGELPNSNDKQVYLTKKQVRAVPLIHYSFITTNQGIFKKITDKAVQQEIKNATNKPFVIQDEKNVFNDTQYQITAKMLKLFDKNEIRVKRQHVLNKVTEYLVQHEMLPALCYVFSRKQLEKCAEELTTNLTEFDSKVAYIVDRECEQIIRKLPNYQEYLQLPEYLNLIKLLRKGVGIHHAGMMPILREIVELLFARGFIKLLFCTETMSVGINLPVKTTIFTDIVKYNGEINRTLYSHEYTQSAGRAGRLGLDYVGHVIHLNNLFRNVDHTSYKNMMNGKPQKLTSKFKISYNLLLNLLDIGDTNLVTFASRSMTTGDIDAQTKEIYYKMTQLETDHANALQNVTRLRTPKDVIQKYTDIQENAHMYSNKKKKEAERTLKQMEDDYRTLKQDVSSYNNIREKEKEINRLQQEMEYLNKYFHSGINKVLELLREYAFVEQQQADQPTLTLKGKIAAQIRETHCLVFASLLDTNQLDHLSSKQLVAVFGCFTNISVQEDNRDLFPNSEDKSVNQMIKKIVEMHNKYMDIELKRDINTGFEYNTIHYDLLNYVEEWYTATDVESCKLVLQKIGKEKGIFLGEFVKALLKINNISCEMEKIAEMTGNVSLLSKLKEIPDMTLKYVVTNQSLYV